jgi:hypothetical protein
MTKRYNPPPNWPPPPSPDWQPSAGWRPDPAWGPPPEGWQLWTDDDAKKNWFLRHKILTGLGALILLFVAIAGVSGGEKAPDTPTAQTTPAPSEEAEATESAEALTPSPARSPTPTPTPTPTPEPEPEVVGFGDGTHRVGEDIEPGTYRSDESSLCYWARLAGFSGELEDIVANGNSGPEIVTITEDDAGFETSNCGDWVPVETTFPETPETSFEDGTFVVGSHIEPGTYRADGAVSDLCYWARLSEFAGEGVDGIITNGNGPTVIEISADDAGFTSFGCGTWSRSKSGSAAESGSDAPPLVDAAGRPYPGREYTIADRMQFSADVLWIQQQLRIRGHEDVEADGSFGPRTRDALMEEQAANGLFPDGRAGPKTWEMLGGG